MPKRNGVGIELLADPTRRRIVALIARGVHRPSRIAAELGLSRPAVSRQLRLLDEAGLIEAHGFPADRRGYAYHFNPRMAAPMVAWLAGTEIGLARELVARTVTLPPVSTDLATVSGTNSETDEC
jgi:DNA-binding transcriptional ArsR family regulator